MTDDDVRSMLRRRAAEATVSDDAWERIAMRLAEPAPTRTGRRLAVAGVAVAAAAATVFAANLPGSPSQVADTTTTSEVAAPAARGPVDAARRWLADVLPDVALPAGQLQGGEDGNASVLFRSDAVDTEVFVRQLSGRPGWVVVAAASDMIPLFDVTFDGRELLGRAGAGTDAVVEITYLLDGTEESGGVRDVSGGEDVMLGVQPNRRVEEAAVRVVLRAAGTAFVSYTRAQRVDDPAVSTGSYVAVWPATDSAGLAALQRQADDGHRPDLLDPEAVAGAFLAELLPRGASSTSYAVGEFGQGDPTSGEVPYELGTGETGTILLRRTGGEGSIWYVTGAVTDALEIVRVRREETHLVADVRSSLRGTLTWTGATPVDVDEGQLVSIGRPDTPAIGSYPVVIRLVDGERTLAIAATLG